MKELIFSLFRKVVNALTNKGVQRILGVNSIYKFIYNTFKPKGIILIDIQGNKMYVDLQDQGVTPSLLAPGRERQYMTELLEDLIKPGMIVVDIGANIGYYTLIAAKLVEAEGKVYAFEPEPHNYTLLVKNIEINTYSNIIPVQEAISNKNGKAKFFIDKVNFGGSSFSGYNIPKKNSFIEVETITLDDFLRNELNNTNVNFIKMDTQGAEGLIVEGANKTLENNDLKIIMEFWPYGLKNNETDPLKLLHRLKNFGFKIKIICQINKSIKHKEIMEIIEMCESVENGKGFVNILLER